MAGPVQDVLDGQPADGNTWNLAADDFGGDCAVNDDQYKSCPCGHNDRINCTQHNAVKQVIIIRRDLKMRRGKEIAQGAHASMAWLTDQMGRPSPTYPDFHVISLNAAQRLWVTGSFRKITCQVPNEPALRAIVTAANFLGVTARLITDSGLTEFGGVPTVTAAAVGPDWDDKVDQITGKLDLY